MLIFLGWMWSGSNRGWTTFGDGNISEPRSTILELEMKKRTWNSSRRDSFSVYILYIRNICLCLHGDTEYYLHSSPKKRETRNKSKIFIQQQRESIIIKEWRERQKKKKKCSGSMPTHVRPSIIDMNIYRQHWHFENLYLMPSIIAPSFYNIILLQQTTKSDDIDLSWSMAWLARFSFVGSCAR
jgi:hypothetical protein